MDVEFEDEALKRVEEELDYTAGWPPGIVKAFRMRMQFIRSAKDERDFMAWRALRFEKLKAELDGYHSMRLNDQWRLLVKLRKEQTGKVVVVVSIVDYH